MALNIEVETKDLDIEIKNEEVVNIIDQLAENKKLSRSEFLKQAIENLVISKELSNIDTMFSELIKKNLSILNLNTNALSVFCDENIIDISSFIIN